MMQMLFVRTQRCRLYSVSSHSSTPAAICAATALRPPGSDATQGSHSAAATPITSSGPQRSGTTHLSVTQCEDRLTISRLLANQQMQLHSSQCPVHAACAHCTACSFTERRVPMVCHERVLQDRSPDGAAERLQRRRGEEARGAAHRGVHPRPVVRPQAPNLRSQT